MAAEPLAWWARREMGNEHDPYNQCPKLDPASEDWTTYTELSRQVADDILAAAHTDCRDGWEGGYTKDGIVVHYKKNTASGSEVMSFRGYGIIENCTPEILRLFIVQIDQRVYWDPTFMHGSYNVEVSPEVRIMSHAYNAPWPVHPRDFVTIGVERLESDGTLVTGCQSVVRDDLPELKGFVRGWLSASGFVLRPLAPSPTGTPRCGVYYLATVDVKGWLPTWVVNLVNAQQPLNINSLSRLIHHVQEMVLELLGALHTTTDSDWSAARVSQLVDRVAADHDFTAKKTILTDPLRYFLMDRRVGPTDDALYQHIQQLGKQATLKTLLRRFSAYTSVVDQSRVAPFQIYLTDA